MVTDLDEVGGRSMGHGVELRRWNGDASVGQTGADQLSITQAGEESAEHRPHRSRVVEGDRDGGLKGAAHDRK